MRSGALRHFAEIQRQVPMGRTPAGEQIYVWAKLIDAYCEVTPRRGKEHFDPNTKQRFSQVVYLFRFRLFEVEGVDATMRIVFERQNYTVQHMIPDQENHEDCIIECWLQDSVVGNRAIMLFLDESAPSGEVGVPYAGATVSVKDGMAPYTFSIDSGVLPAGLTIASSSGVVSGTPTTAGTFTAVVKVVDANGKIAMLPPLAIIIVT